MSTTVNVLEERELILKKIQELEAQKRNLGGSKNKKNRTKVNKKIAQAKKKLAKLEEQEKDEVISQEKVKERQKEDEEKKIQLEQKKKKEVERERELAQKHNAIITLPVSELAQYIGERRVPQEDYHLASFWDYKLTELAEEVQQETQAQQDFLKRNNISKEDQKRILEAFVAKGKSLEDLRRKAAEKKAAEEAAAQEQAEKEEEEEENTTKKAATEVPEENTQETEQAAEESGPMTEEQATMVAAEEEEPEIIFLDDEDQNNTSETPPEAEDVQQPEDDAVEASNNITEETTKRNNYGSAQYWDDRYEKFQDKTEEWYEGWNTLREIVSPYLSTDQIIVDFGCGDSFLQDELRKEGYLVLGNDISNNVLQRLSTDTNREMFSANGFSLPMRDNSVDVIIDKGTLDAISCDDDADLDSLFKELFRTLRPEGSYICVTPWNESKRTPQLSAVGWDITHEMLVLSKESIQKKRFNQLKEHPVLGQNKKKLWEMAGLKAQQELDELDLERERVAEPHNSAVVHVYICTKQWSC